MRDGKSLSGADDFSDYFDLMISLELCAMANDSDRNGSAKRSRRMASPGVMLSRELQVTLQLAMTEAQSRRHEYVCLEHVLYAMLHDFTTSNVLKQCGANIDSLRRKLQGYLDEGVERLGRGRRRHAALRDRRAARIAARGAARAVGGPPGDKRSGRADRDVPGGRVVRALLPARGRRHPLRRDQFRLAWRLQGRRRRRSAGARRQRGQAESEDEHDHEEGEGDDEEEGAPKLSPARALKRYAINLAERAAKGKIDPLDRAQE